MLIFGELFVYVHICSFPKIIRLRRKRKTTKNQIIKTEKLMKTETYTYKIKIYTEFYDTTYFYFYYNRIVFYHGIRKTKYFISVFDSISKTFEIR